MRVIGFQPGQRKKLMSFQEKMEIENCEVRNGYQSKEINMQD